LAAETEDFRELKQRYSELLLEYQNVKRAKKPEVKVQLDEVRDLIHTKTIESVKKEITIMERENTDPKSLIKLKKKLIKLLSKIDHQYWLEWSRSVWPFKATESRAKTGLHPAQFSSKIPEIIIKFFSFVEDTVLDPFIGTGTTLEVARSLNRNSIGVDINPHFLELCKRRLEGEFRPYSDEVPTSFTPRLLQGDARNLSIIKDNSVQLIVTHPPYWNAVRISELPEDLSNSGDEDYSIFLNNMKESLKEMYRVLEPERVAAIVIGDVMRKVNGVTQLFPLHADIIKLAQETGFILWDIYIWETKMRNSGGMPMMGSYPYPQKIFSQFAHNYVLILRKH